MSVIGEAVLKAILRLRSGRTASPPVSSSHNTFADYIRWQYDSSARLFARYSGLDVSGKRVLEIGCGTGGRAAYLASLGAREVVGIDINDEEIGVARRRCPELFPELADRLVFLHCKEDGRLDIEPFDVVIMVDTIEHVVSPAKMLRLAYSYTAAGGVLYFSSIGWHNHSGSHLGLLPFDNLLFSDETLINVIRWKLSQPDYVPSRFDSNPPTERWLGIYDLRDRPGEHLNKISLREIKKLAHHSQFSEAKIEIVGFGHKHPLLRLLDPLRHVPVIQEIYHSLVVVECRRASEDVHAASREVSLSGRNNRHSELALSVDP